MGALPITQKYMTFKKAVDYMLDTNTFLQVQNGIATGLKLQPDVPLFLHNGRGLAAYTHSDVLYQAYFTAYLVLNTINGGNPAPLNPGNPYNTSKTQNGFGYSGSARYRSDRDRGGARGAQRGVVPEMVCASSPSSGIRRRYRLSEETGEGNRSRATSATPCSNSKAVRALSRPTTVTSCRRPFPKARRRTPRIRPGTAPSPVRASPP